MAVIILTDNSFLLNRLDSQALFSFEKSTQTRGFDPMSWRLFAYIPGNLIQKEAPTGLAVRGDAPETESVGGIKPVHAPTPHWAGPLPPPARVGVVVAFLRNNLGSHPKQEKHACVVNYY